MTKVITIKATVWVDIEDENWTFKKDDWNIRSTNTNISNITVMYYCVHKISADCKGNLRLRYDLGKTKILSKEYSIPHNERCKILKSKEPTKPISKKDLSEKIIDLNKCGVVSKIKIQQLLIKDGIEAEIKQIYNTLSNHKRKKTKISNNFSREDLIEICNKYSYASEQEPFVLAYTIEPIRVLLTIRKNLLWLCEATSLHLDGTYRINIYSFPVIVIGCTDLNRKFFCAAICFAEHEDTDTIAWILKTIKDYIQKNNKFLSIKNVVADNAPAITKAVKDFDINLQRTNCWAHIARLIKTKSKQINTLHSEFMSDIYLMQRLTDKKVYMQLLELLKSKYGQFEFCVEFIEMFFNNYVSTNSNWYEAYSVFEPSTNNATERFNLLIKSNYAEWSRLDFDEFTEISLQILRDFSKYQPCFRKIVYNKDEMGNEKRLYFKQMVETVEWIYILVSDKENIYSETNISCNFHKDFPSFNACKNFYEHLIYLTRRRNIITWKDIFCSCLHFSKLKKCCHVYKYLIQVKTTDIVDVNVMSLKKKRGRPKLIPKNASLCKE